MTRYLLPLLAATALCAAPIVIKESPDRKGYYEIAPQQAQSTTQSQNGEKPIGVIKFDRNAKLGVKANRYYRNGDPAQEYVSTGSLIISFSKAKGTSDIEAFATKWNLTGARQISKMFHTWVFGNNSSDDDLTLASKIAEQESDISFAKPDFIAKIKLR